MKATGKLWNVDLHAHYDMHIVAGEMDNRMRMLKRAVFGEAEGEIEDRIATLGIELSEAEVARYTKHRQKRNRRKVAHWLFHIINKLGNDPTPSSGPAVTAELMDDGDMGVVLAPVYDPFDEFGVLPTLLLLIGFFVILGVILVTWSMSYSYTFGPLLFWIRAPIAFRIGFGLLVLGIVGFAALLMLNWRAAGTDASFDELPGSPPRADYFVDLLAHFDEVEEDLEGTQVTVVNTYPNLKKAKDDQKIALIHCVEGGFQLGATTKEVTDNVGTLAKRGVGYVTLAHLFYRGVATNAPAIPFLSDTWYRQFLPQPSIGLSALGRAAVAAMFKNGILIDITHMSQVAIDETFELLEDLEKCHRCLPVPVLATHIACRFGSYEYNLSDATIQRIWDRKGLMGVIFCDHWMSDGRSRSEEPALDRTLRIINENIDHIESLTASGFKSMGIGSDLDGFIQPTLKGLQDMSCMTWLRTNLGMMLSTQLEGESLDTAVHDIMSGNALRVLESAWQMTPADRPLPA